MQMIHHLSRLPALMSTASLFTLMLLTFSDVVLRSIANAPIEITADLTRLLMAIMVFSALPILSASGKHISVDLLEGPIARLKLMRCLDIVVNLLCGMMLVLPAKRIFDIAERSRSYGDVMEYMGLPLHYIGLFIALMTALTALVLVVKGLILMVRPRLFEAIQ